MAQTKLKKVVVAEAVRDFMAQRDRASLALGMTVGAVSPGRACVSMRVREDMLNGLDLCHGGIVCTLADSAFAYACNTGNELTVASGFSIELLATAHLGDMLTATAVEVSRGGRIGLYDVEVRNADGVLVAMFRGRSYTMKDRSVMTQA